MLKTRTLFLSRDGSGPVLLVLGHKVVVELLNLGDVLVDTGAQGGNAHVVSAGLLAEARASDSTDTGGVCTSVVVINEICGVQGAGGGVRT